ncbi:MAG TPA: MauE/DoxX family redox-associated membrane protein [Pyrinomonadaceae bacterium]
MAELVPRERGGGRLARAAAALRAETPAERLRLLRVVLALATLGGFALSHRLWLSTGRTFPTVPVFDFLPRVPAPLDLAWLAALAALLAWSAASKRPRPYLFASLALAVSLALWDQTRWQPWFYQYVFVLFVLAAAPEGAGGEEATLRACGLLVASLYFWAGVQKLNPRFFDEVVPSLVTGLPAALARLVTPLAVLVPLTEVCAGLLLLTHRWRRVGVALALATHVCVLLLFFPSRRNKVVWPWNVAMAAFVLLIFRDGAHGLRGFLPRGPLSPQSAAVAFFCLMPLLSFFGLWGRYVSGAVYSGNTARGSLRLSAAVAGGLPPPLRRRLRPADGGAATLDINHWAYADLQVPAYPSARVYRGAARRLCESAGAPSEVVLTLAEAPRLFGGPGDVTALDCDALSRQTP